MARLLPLRRAREVRRRLGAPRRYAVRGALHHRGHAPARQHRGARLGRCLVPARLLRRRHASWLCHQRRLPDRFATAELGAALGRRRSRAHRPWPRSRRYAPRASRHRRGPAVRSSVRSLGAQARLHQGLRSGCARERRSVHARGRVGGDGVRGERPHRARMGDLRSDQSRAARRLGGRDRDLQGRAIRRRRRCLHEPATRGPWRVDLVHGIGRLDVPAHH